MKKIFLHIGCEKTGTTSIQTTLFENKGILQKNYATLYPNSLGGKNHWKLALYSCDEDKNLERLLPKGEVISEFRKRLRNEFVQEVRRVDSNVIIISNEWLHPRVKSKEEFKRLMELLHLVSTDIEVIMFIRQQDKMAISLYSTSLRAGNYKQFSFPNIVRQDRLPYYYDFLSIYRNWVSNFGAKQVKIRVFDKAVLYKNDAVEDFLHCLGMDSTLFEKDQSRNFSISNEGVKFVRSLNWLLKYTGFFINQRRARLLSHAVVNSFKGKATLGSDDDCQMFLSHFDISNKQLRSEYTRNTGDQIDSFGLKEKR